MKDRSTGSSPPDPPSSVPPATGANTSTTAPSCPISSIKRCVPTTSTPLAASTATLRDSMVSPASVTCDSAGEAVTVSTCSSGGAGSPSFAATWAANSPSTRASCATTAERISGISTLPSSKANAATMCSASTRVMLIQNIRAWL